MTYEMLVGEPPFTGPTAQAIVAKVMTAEPAGLTAQRRSVPPAVEDAVLTALAKLPADRFATAAEFAAALVTTVDCHPADDRDRSGPARAAQQIRVAPRGDGRSRRLRPRRPGGDGWSGGHRHPDSRRWSCGTP